MALTYVEASVFVAWALDFDPFHSRAEQIIRDIDSGKIAAITSSLSVMEVVDSIRRRITERAQWVGDPASPRTNVKPVGDEIERVVTQFLDGLTALVLQDKIMWTDPISPMLDVFQDAVDVLLATSGGFGQRFKELKTCYFYRGVGQYDVQHALIAKSFGATNFLSFDQGFSELGSLSDFSGIITFSVR
jgi:predicted nucleic acid-binding protein